MTTNKPEVWAIIDKHCSAGVILIQHGHKKLADGDRLIRLSDYEALQAECAGIERDYLTILEAQDAEHRKQTAKLQSECDKLRALLIEIERGCSWRDTPSERTISSWADAINAALATQD